MFALLIGVSLTGGYSLAGLLGSETQEFLFADLRSDYLLDMAYKHHASPLHSLHFL